MKGKVAHNYGDTLYMIAGEEDIGKLVNVVKNTHR